MYEELSDNTCTRTERKRTMERGRAREREKKKKETAKVMPIQHGDGAQTGCRTDRMSSGLTGKDIYWNTCSLCVQKKYNILCLIGGNIFLKTGHYKGIPFASGAFLFLQLVHLNSFTMKKDKKNVFFTVLCLAAIYGAPVGHLSSIGFVRCSVTCVRQCTLSLSVCFRLMPFSVADPAETGRGTLLRQKCN